MNTWFASYHKKMDALNFREQLIVLAGALLVIYFIWDILLFSPMHQKKINTQEQIEQVKAKLIELENQLEEANKKIRSLQAEAEGEGKPQKFALQINKVIPIMTELMNKQPGLELVSISTRPPEPVKLDDVLPGRINPNQAEAAKAAANKLTKPSDSSASAGPDLFKHVITMRFRGDYFNTLQFLEKIESLPWLLVHNNILYSVTTYPKADVTIQLDLFSLAGGII